MLTMSYAQALADPTYCDTGKTGGAELVKLFGVKKNEARPLKEIFKYTTVAEILWCLRVVKGSQQHYAIHVANAFILDCLGRVPLNKDSASTEYVAAHKIHAISQRKGDFIPSQNAIDVSAAAIQYARFSGREAEEEAAQRAFLESVL